MNEPVWMTAPGEETPVVGDEVPGLVFFKTSGSTGEPKWIGHRRESLAASARAVNAHLEVAAESCWALALPDYHVGGFGVLARVAAAGCRLARWKEKKWRPGAFGDWAGEQGITHLSLVPTQVHDLVKAAVVAPATLRAVVVGGGVLAEATGRAARALGWPVLASYGMTETASQIATQRLERLSEPYRTAPLDLIEPWQARLAEDGRIELRGPSLYRGMLIRRDGEWKYEESRSEWLATSDLGRISTDGLTVLGRADSLVKILGELVDPVAVERELFALGGDGFDPTSLAVVAVEEARAGCRLVVAFTPALEVERVHRLVEAYHGQCPGFRRIGRLAAVPEIPLSPLGKPLRAKLAESLRGNAI